MTAVRSPEGTWPLAPVKDIVPPKNLTPSEDTSLPENFAWTK